MSIIHFGSMTAAGAGSAISELNPSFLSTGLDAQGSSSPWAAGAQIILYGDTNVASEGTWYTDESGIGSNTGTWLDDTSETGKWMVRFVKASDYGGPSNDLNLYYNSSVAPAGWGPGNGQSNWVALGSSWGYVGQPVDTQLDFGAGWSYGTSGMGLFADNPGFGSGLEFAKGATGLIESFDSADVTTGTNRITITGHGYNQGDQVIYTVAGGGSAPNPLVTNGFYTVIYVDANTIQLATYLINAGITPTPINITTAGSGTGHTLQRIEADAIVSFVLEAND